MNTNYYDYQILFEECWNEGFREFDACPVWAQEKLAKNYWLSFDKAERMEFMAYIEEHVMSAAYEIDNPLTQTIIEGLLVDFYGPQIDEHFKAIKRKAA